MQLKNPNRWIINETRRWTSLAKKLRDEKKIDEHFEIILNNLTLEDVIALKLEFAARTLNSPLFGQPLWEMLRYITRDAVLKFAVSTTATPSEAASFLGLTQSQLFKLTRKYGLWNYFDHVYLKKMKEKMLARKLKKEEMKNATQNEATDRKDTGE